MKPRFFYGLAFASSVVCSFAIAGCRCAADGSAAEREASTPAILGKDDLGTPQILVKRLDGTVSSCSGTLIRPNWILTSRRCVTVEQNNKVGTTIAPQSLSATLLNGTNSAIGAHIVKHPSLDVALVHLNTALVTSDGRRFSSRVYLNSVAQLSGKALYGQGWGRDGAAVCDASATTTPTTKLYGGKLQISDTASFTGFRVTPGADSGMGLSGNTGNALFQSVNETRRLAGVQSSCSCRKSSKSFKSCNYVRADAIRGWIEGVTGTAPALGSPVAAERSDGSSAVVYRDASNQLRELCLSGSCGSTWRKRTLHDATVAKSDLAGYVRVDGTNALVYRNDKNHIVELRLDGRNVGTADLTEMARSPEAVGNPSAYIRSDGHSVVIFRSVDSHIREIALAPPPATWHEADLMETTTAPLADSDAIGYVRVDGVNAVVYRSATDKHIHEIALPIGGTWQTSDISAAIDAPESTGNPRPYTRTDAVSAVVYRSRDNHIVELSRPLDGQAWQLTDLTTVTGAPEPTSEPIPYVRADGGNAILYLGTNKHVYELNLPLGTSTWGLTDITTTAATTMPSPMGTPAEGHPIGYVRADGVNAVVFQSADAYIYELYLNNKTWTAANLSAIGGGA